MRKLVKGAPMSQSLLCRTQHLIRRKAESHPGYVVHLSEVTGYASSSAFFP